MNGFVPNMFSTWECSRSEHIFASPDLYPLCVAASRACLVNAKFWGLALMLILGWLPVFAPLVPRHLHMRSWIALRIPKHVHAGTWSFNASVSPRSVQYGSNS